MSVDYEELEDYMLGLQPAMSIFDLVIVLIENNGPLLSCKLWDVNFNENSISNILVNFP